MPFAVAAPIAGAVGGALVSSALSPGTSGGSGGGPNYYIPTGLSSADQSWQNLLQQQTGNQQTLNATTLPYYYSSLNNGTIANQLYGPGYQQAAQNASNEYSNLANNLNGIANNAFGTQQALLNAGQNVYNMGLDPQNALYNRTVQQLQDQTGATNSMYGLGSSAAGAGVANQALGNFNIDWQNNQLSRALQGLQGYGQAAQQGGQYGQYGANLLEASPGYALQAGQVPYSVGQTIAANPGQLAGQYSSGLEQGPLSSANAINSQIIPYLNYGQGAQQVPYQNAAQGAGAAGALVSQGINSLGSNPQVQSSIGNAFSNYFNPASGSFSGGNFGGAFTSNPYYSGGGNSYGFTS